MYKSGIKYYKFKSPSRKFFIMKSKLICRRPMIIYEYILMIFALRRIKHIVPFFDLFSIILNKEDKAHAC